MSRYILGELNNSRIEEIDHHLLECAFCSALSEQVADTTQEFFERDLEVAPSHALSFLTKAVAASLGTETLARLRERIERWIQIGPELMVNVRLPKPGGLAAFSVTGMADMLAPSSEFNLEMASVGVSRGLASADGGLDGPVLEIPGLGKRRARVVVDVTESTTRISVQVDSVPSAIQAPLAAVQLKDTGQAFVQPMRHVESASGNPAISDLIADFNLPMATREVLVLIETLES
jgi:hypothetical protein